MAESGIFYGVGVGPGDPRLLTLKACDVIRAADQVAYPVNGEGESRARAIAAAEIPQGAAELPIHVPMGVDRAPAQAAYDAGAEAIAGHLEAGRSVAYLCEGDPLLYGSFIYLLTRLGGRFPTEIVPGVTGVSASAADLRHPLAAGAEVLKVVPATLDQDRLRAELEGAQAAAIVKVGRHFDKVRQVLDSLGLAEQASLVEDAAGANGSVTAVADLADGAQPYFSTILVRRGAPPC